MTSKLLSAIDKPFILWNLNPPHSFIQKPSWEIPLHFPVFSLPHFYEAGTIISTSFSLNEEISSKGLSDLPKVVQLLIGEARA